MNDEKENFIITTTIKKITIIEKIIYIYISIYKIIRIFSFTIHNGEKMM